MRSNQPRRVNWFIHEYRKMKIKIISAYNEGYEDIGSLSAKSIALYSIAHGYDYEIFKLENFDRPASWSKIYYLMQEIQKKTHEYLFWVDADACFIRSDADIADETISQKDIYLVNHLCTRRPDKNERGLHVQSEIPNCGTMLIKSTDWSSRFLKLVWDDIDYLHHVWWEQAVFHKLMGYHYEISHGQFKNVPNEQVMSHFGWLNGIWNCVPTSSQGDMGVPITVNPHNPAILHFAGMKNSIRIEEMRKLKMDTTPLYKIK